MSTPDALSKLLRDGTSHPASAEVLQLARLAAALQAAWSALDEVGRQWVLSQPTEPTECENAAPGAPSIQLRKYLELDDRVKAVAGSLWAQEVSKIQQALAALDDWLLHAG